MTEKVGKDSLFIAGIFVVIAIVILIDVINDLKAGGSLIHVGLEICVVGLALAALGWIGIRSFRAMQDRIEVSQQRLQELEGEAARWREQVARLKPNLEDALTKQFKAWKFTEAEEEIARLILKGLSNKEIAEVRASSEKTIKQHTTAIYRKSGLTSRSQIAAFFLEDLF